MKLNDCKINGKDLWHIMSIREETEDHYGRKGRGIDLIYFNQEYKDTNFIAEDNIKEAILKFKNILINSLYTNEEIEKEIALELVEDMTIHNDLFLNLIKDFKKIFGEFDNDTR